MSIFLSEYNVTPTTSGETLGEIDVINVSGGTPPYTVSWSGANANYISNGFTSNQWDLYNLAEGIYEATITDASSVTGSSAVVISAYTLPIFSADVTSYSCVTNPNLFCEVTVYTAQTSSLYNFNQSATTLNYSLYRDGTLFESKLVSTANTVSSQVFEKLPNGEYTLTIGRQESLTRKFLITDSVCTATSYTKSASTSTPFSAITSNWTKNSHFAAGNYYVGHTPSIYTTGLYNWGQVLDSNGHWFFTGDSTTGILDYPISNPNTGRTTDTNRNWYLGVSGSSDCQEGWNCGPTGPNTDPIVARTAYDLTGATINTSAFRGTYYYHRYLNKFFVWETTTGVTNSDYAWITFNPTADRDSKGDPVSSEIITQKPSTFEMNMIQHDSTFWATNAANVVVSATSYCNAGLQTNYLQSTVKLGGGIQSGDTQQTSYISPCSYLDYTHDIYLRGSGNTELTSSIVLAYFRDNYGTYGESGATHYLTLDFLRCCGVTVSFNKGQSARAFQRDAYGQTIIQGNPEESDDDVVQSLVRKAQEEAISQFRHEYPELYDSLIGGGEDSEVEGGADEEGHGGDSGSIHDILRGNDTYMEIYDRILLQVLSDYEATLSEGEQQYITTTYKEFDSIVLTNGPRDLISGTHCSPWDCGSEIQTQGCLKVRVVRSGSQGELFNIKMTDTMGETSGFATSANATKDAGAENPFNAIYEINFNLNDSTTWSGSTHSAPDWVSGTELQRFLGGQRMGYMANQYLSIVYGMGFTGTGANYNMSLGNPQLIANSTAITLTQKVEYNADTEDSKSLVEVVGNNNIVETKNCDYHPRCDSELTIPLVKPRLSASIQSFIEPTAVLEGLSKYSTDISNVKIMNVSGYTGNTPIITANTSGNTSDLLINQSYLKLDVHTYDHEQSSFNIKPNYTYLFNTMSEISSPQFRKKGTSLSATTNIPLSGLPTGSSWQYIVKPSFIFKDKTTKEPIWVDTTDNTNGVSFNKNKDYYMVVVEPPSEPILNSVDINFKNTRVSPIVLTNKNLIVDGVPSHSGSKSAFTYSALTLPYQPNASVIQVFVNGLLLRESQSSPANNTYPGTLIWVGGEYYFNDNRLILKPQTVVDGDVVQVIYPRSTEKSYYNQNVNVGTPTTDSNSVMYKNEANYFINLEYPPIGSVTVSLNGQVLTENNDFIRVGASKIQFLTYTVGGSTDFTSSDTIVMYYITQYNLVGLASTKEPRINVELSKKLGLKEELKLAVYDSDGNVVQEELTSFKTTDDGKVSKTFFVTVPNPGTYSYNLESRRYYPLLTGKEIKTERSSRYVSFTIDRATFYSPNTSRPLGGIKDGL